MIFYTSGLGPFVSHRRSCPGSRVLVAPTVRWCFRAHAQDKLAEIQSLENVRNVILIKYHQTMVTS